MVRSVVAIDDDVDTLEALSIALKMHGYGVYTACTGMEGIQLVRLHQPDLILVDVMLPRMDGYQVCRQLRADPATAHIPIVMVSARGRLADQAAGIEAGATRYVLKPLSIRSLVTLVDALTSVPAPVAL